MGEEDIKLKIDELQKIIDVWARKNSILHPGERLVFSLRIEQSPLVVIETNASFNGVSNHENFLEMSVRGFFSKERLMDIGGTSEYLSTLAHNALLNAKFSEGEIMIQKTMREFVASYPLASKLKRVKNLGKKGTNAAIKVLRSAGLPIKDDRKDWMK